MSECQGFREVLDLLRTLDTSNATDPDEIGPKLLFKAGLSMVPTRLLPPWQKDVSLF